TLCNARGARDVPVAEWVAGALLGDASGLLRSAARQYEREWRPSRPAQVAGSTVLIVVPGSIGEGVRRRAQASCLQVVAVVDHPEPLPADHPLWTTPGVTITPHVSGDSPLAERRAERLAGEQLARFARGEPLRNVVR